MTPIEARWAVFFDSLGDGSLYDPQAAWGLGNDEHYQPQFLLNRPHGSYLEVQRPDDNRTRVSLGHYHSEIEEHPVYLAVGDLPDERQLQVAGWWDSGRQRGVKNLTPCSEWGRWFPPHDDSVLRALEVARDMEFEPAIPSVRQEENEVRDLPEKEREQRPD